MHSAKTTSALAILLIGFLIARVGPAAACGSGKLLFDNGFQNFDQAWILAGDSDTPKVGSDGLAATLSPDHTAAAKTNDSYSDVEICTVVTSNSPKDSTNLFAIRFWFGEHGVSYWANAFPAKGLFFVGRFEEGKDMSIVTPKELDPSLLNASGTNEFSVRLRGADGAFFVNGKRVSGFRREPSGGESPVGFNAASSDKNTQPTVFTLRSFQVRALTDAEVQTITALEPAPVEFCNEFGRPLHIAIAYPAGDAWTSEGWLTIKNGECQRVVKHPDLTTFYYHAETDVYDGKRIEWGKDRQFAVKKGGFTLPHAETKAPGSYMTSFVGPKTRDVPARTLSVIFESGRVATVTGPNPH